MTTPTLKIALVAGEASGDFLGAGLIKALRSLHPNIHCEGIAGPLMQAQGCVSLFPMETLAVMGFGEVLWRLGSLLKMRRRLVTHWRKHPPDVFIGIDAPDFNLGLERRLHPLGIKVVHYNSPKVWAWRQGRLKSIKAATDLMLVLLPFEAVLYEAQQIPVCFVGHPMADQIPLSYDVAKYRESLGFATADRLIALLPGSRGSELKYLGALFIETARACLAKDPALKFIAPMANQTRYAQFQQLLATIAPQLPIKLVLGQARDAMAASDVVLLACGTATLEALLLRKPMVVAYKVSAITYQIARHLVKLTGFSFPNLLTQTACVPEFIQDQATPDTLSVALLAQLNDPDVNQSLLAHYETIHLNLRRDANMQSAKAIMHLLGTSS